MSPEPIPFHVTPPGGDAGHLLLVGYHFPPDPVVGALRWQKLAQLAAERGWGLDVLTQDPATLAARDDARLADLPRGVRVYGVPSRALWRDRAEHALWRLYRGLHRATPAGGSPSPGAAAAPRTRPVTIPRGAVHWVPRRPRALVRAYFAWMEYARPGAWAREAARLGVRLARARRPLAVVSSGPPHFATHEAARRIARTTGVPLVLDFRDPWSSMPDLPEGIASPVWWHLAEHHEGRAVRAAALVVTTTDQLRRALERLYPATGERMITVFNGYDEEPLPTSRRGRRFTIAFAGSIYMTRDPRPLLRAVARLVAGRGLTPDDLGVEFLGEVQEFEGRSMAAMAAEAGLADFVRIFPTRPRREALQFLADAHVLVSLPQDSTLTIPAKIFEYARFPAWVLALGGPESASAGLVRELGGDAVPFADTEAIAALLGRRYEQHLAGETPRPLAEGSPRYSRRAQGQRLLDAIAALAGPR